MRWLIPQITGPLLVQWDPYRFRSTSAHFCFKWLRAKNHRMHLLKSGSSWVPIISRFRVFFFFLPFFFVQKRAISHKVVSCWCFHGRGSRSRTDFSSWGFHMEVHARTQNRSVDLFLQSIDLTLFDFLFWHKKPKDDAIYFWAKFWTSWRFILGNSPPGQCSQC